MTAAEPNTPLVASGSRDRIDPARLHSAFHVQGQLPPREQIRSLYGRSREFDRK
jgi:hypothetical protein